MDKITIGNVDYCVISDGKICPELYDKSSIKVVHVLKEVTLDDCNQEGGLGRKLIGVVQDGRVKYRLWNVTARRSYALHHGLPEWNELPKDRFGDAFIASAVINLNDTKPVGTEKRPETSNRSLWDMALARWPYRKPDLLKLDPTVVVCGGTAWLLKKLLHEDHETIQPIGEGCFVWNRIPFIDAYHPSFMRKKHALEYDEFCKKAKAASCYCGTF